jgi:hypothetical protein
MEKRRGGTALAFSRGRCNSGYWTFFPVSVVVLASSDALLITGAFYQLLSVQFATPIVQDATSFPLQFSQTCLPPR